MKILFQGDSITDSNRDYGDIHDLGDGYAHYAAGFISEKYPECTFEFVNQGINGNKTEDLLNRVQSDLVDIQPDIVSIMIGINDVWYYSEDREWLSNEVFEERYRTIQPGQLQLGSELFLRYSRLFTEGPDRRAGGVARSIRVLVEFQPFTLLYPKHD